MFVLPTLTSINLASSIQYLTSTKQCADITFSSDPIMMVSDCANSTGVGAEPATPSKPDTPPAQTSTNAASKLTGGVVVAGILAVFGFVL